MSKKEIQELMDIIANSKPDRFKIRKITEFIIQQATTAYAYIYIWRTLNSF